MANVFALNVAYDVEVKLLSFQLLVMAGFLLVPELPRLVNLFVLNRAVVPVERPRLFAGTRFERLATVLPCITALVVTGLTFSSERAVDERFGAPKPATVPYYGTWDVEEFSLDGTPLAPLTTDEVRWQRVVFDARDYAYVQRMSGSMIVAFIQFGAGPKTLTFDHSRKPRPELKEMFGTPWKAEFTCDDTAPDVLVLTGKYDNRAARVKLRKSRERYFLAPHERQWILRDVPVFPWV